MLAVFRTLAFLAPVQTRAPAAELRGDPFGAALPTRLELRLEPWYDLPAVNHGEHGFFL